MKPTEEQVTAEIAALRELAGRLPNARRNLNIVIEELEDRASVDDIYDAYDTEDAAFQYALDAAMWLDGQTNDKPSSGWE